MRVVFEKENCIHGYLYHEDKLTETQRDLCAKISGQVLAVTYAALGLDMKGILSPSENA